MWDPQDTAANHIENLLTVISMTLQQITEIVNRKVQDMPQSQTVANPQHQEEEKKDKNIHTQNKQTNH